MPDNQETAEALKLEVGMKVYDYESGNGDGTIIWILNTSTRIKWDVKEIDHSGHACYCLARAERMRQAYLDREELAELRKFKDTATPHLRAHMTCESCSAQDAEAIRKVLAEEAE